ncbi:MAG: hypothetical protein HYX92_05860 [Chloroflexi bacterium]|nr:hypothetical protein [Chloroflexota bacterium]
MQLEKLGIPTVGIVSSGFISSYEARHRAMGLDVLPRIVVGPALTEVPPERVREEVLARAEDLFRALTEQPKVSARPGPVRQQQVLRYQGRDVLDALRNLNNDFLDRGWGDGFPLVPPTLEEVEGMLTGTSRRRDEVISIMEPGSGMGTVEKIAINCVMAGCLPEHLPVVIAAVEAMAEPKFDLTLIAQSTGPQTPLLVINGPIRKELGINSGRCALGPGAPSRVNTVIGRAVRLVMMNVGHAYPGVADMDTIGSPNKYSMCMGENEEENPWGPLHVEQGFRPDESTVTVFPCGSHVDVADLVSCTPEAVLTTFAYTANAPLTPSWTWLRADGLDQEPLIVLCPDHARIIAEAGWTKNDIRRFMFHNSRVPLRVLKNPTRPAAVAPGWQWLLNQPDDTMVPVVRDPKDYHIVVVGGASGKSAYVWDWSAPVTKAIGR